MRKRTTVDQEAEFSREDMMVFMKKLFFTVHCYTVCAECLYLPDVMDSL